MSNGAAAGAAAAAAIAQAIKASGVVVSVSPETFSAIVKRQERPLVVVARGGVFTTHYKHLTSYKGLAFHCRAPAPLPLPPGTETIEAASMWMPS